MRIAVVRLDHLGDLILCTPLFRALQRARHEVDLVLPDAFLPLFKGHPRLREVFGIGEVAPEFPAKWRPLAAWLRKRRYDAILLPYGRDRRLLLASAFSGVPPWRRLAMWGGIAGRLTLHVCLRSNILTQPRPFADIILDLARYLKVEPHGLQPEIQVASAAQQWAAATLSKHFAPGKIIGIHPGSQGNTCNLPPAVYGKLAHLLLGAEGKELGVSGIVITGTVGERKLLESFPMDVLASPHVWNSMGELTLPNLAALLQRLDAMVVVGTGPLHLASALGTTTVSPFSPMVSVSKEVWGNQNSNGYVVEAPESCCREASGSWHPQICDFRGTITEVDLLTRLKQALPTRHE